MSDTGRAEVDLLIERAIVLPMTGEHDVLWDGAIAVKGDRIEAVGPTDELRRRYGARQTIDAHEQLAMPGLVNTHMHLFGSFMRGLVNDLSFTPWIQKKFFVTSKGLNPDNYYLGTQFAALEMLKSGTTCFLDCGSRKPGNGRPVPGGDLRHDPSWQLHRHRHLRVSQQLTAAAWQPNAFRL